MPKRPTTRLEELFIEPPSHQNSAGAVAQNGGDDTDDEPPSSDAAPDDIETGLHRPPFLPVQSPLASPSVANTQRAYKSLTPDIVMQTGDFSTVIFGDASAAAKAPFLRSYSVDGGTVDRAKAAAAYDPRLTTTDELLTASFSQSHGNVRRWSQTLQRGALRNGKQTMREKSINFMPSRLNMQMSGGDEDGDEGDGAEDELDSEVDRLTQEIEQHEHLMDLTAQSEQQRIDTLRALPKPLSIKREIKSKLTTVLTNKSAQRPIGAVRRMRYAFAMWLNRTEQSTASTLINLELWYGRLKRIEGNCGGAVGTYFKFLRSLFVMNTVLAVFSLGFIVTPQVLYNGMQPTPEPTEATAFHFADLFTAQGFLSDSIVFYGSYTNRTVNTTGRHFYSIPHAYFLTTAALYIATFLVVSIIVARSYRRSFIETAVGALPNLYAQRLFTAWDFSITSHKAAHLKHQHIYNELREVLADIKQPPAEPLPWWQHAIRWLLQAIVHLLVGAVLVGVGYGMWLLMHRIEEERSNRSRLASMYVAVAACGTLAVLQAMFGWLAAAEPYRSGRTRLHVTLLRSYVLELVLGGVLLAYWLSNWSGQPCWETAVGQEIYRLLVVDFVVFVLGGLVWNAGRWSLQRWWWPAVGLPEFDIARGSLGLVFNQSLLWIGMLYAPMLAVLVALKMAVTFYLKEVSLMYFCRPSTTLWRSAQTATLFLVMVFVSLLAVITTNGFIISRIPVSKECGPFHQFPTMVQMFVEDVLKLQRDHLFWRLFMWVTKPAVIGGVLLFMAAITYYMRAKSRSNIGMVKILKEMLVMEGHDKEFLLQAISRVTHGRDELFTMDAPRTAKRQATVSRMEGIVRRRTNAGDVQLRQQQPQQPQQTQQPQQQDEVLPDKNAGGDSGERAL